MNSAATISTVTKIASGVDAGVDRGPRLRTVALPIEHGGWALLFEPIALGLLLAPSTAGVFIALSAVSLFLARHPFKLVVNDCRRKRYLPRTRLATNFGMAYALAAATFFALALVVGGGAFVLPLLLAIPAGAIQFRYDAYSRSRKLTAELAAAITTGSVAVAIAIAGGWEYPVAFALWAISIARGIPSILYVRARLRAMRGQKVGISIVLLMHIAAVGAILALARLKVVPILAVIACAMLAVRAMIGLLGRRQRSARSIGIQEVVYGALTVFAVVTGSAVGW